MATRGSRWLQPSFRTGMTLELTGLGAYRAARGSAAMGRSPGANGKTGGAAGCNALMGRAARGNGAIRRFSRAKGLTSGAAATGPGKATSTSACAI